MRITYQVESCSRHRYEAQVVVIAHARSGGPSSFHANYGKVRFNVPPEEAQNWWCGRIFEVELPEPEPIQQSVLESVDDDSTTGTVTTGLFGRRVH